MKKPFSLYFLLITHQLLVVIFTILSLILVFQPNLYAGNPISDATQGKNKIINLGVAPHIYGSSGDSVEQSMYNLMGQDSSIDYVITPLSKEDFFKKLLWYKKNGYIIKKLVIAGHGAGEYPSIEFGKGVLSYEDIDKPTFINKLNKYKKNRVKYKKIILDHNNDHRAQEHLKSINNKIKILERKINYINSLPSIMSSNGEITLINCSTVETQKGVDFVKNLGNILFGKSMNGIILASKTDVLVDQVKSYLDAQWVSNKTNKQVGIGDFFTVGDWIKIPINGGIKFPTNVEVHFKVIDKKDGKPLKDVTVSWDGNVDKTNKDGYIFSKYTSDLLDSKKVWKIQLHKKGYEGTFYPRRANQIISRYSVNANTAVLEFAMQPLEKLKFTVHIFDYETGGYLKNVIVSTSSKKQQITEDGIVNFKYTYYELVQSLASNIKDLVMKATALGYQAAELNIQIDSLIKNAENNHENILFIYLKRKKITKKSLDLIVELINSDNGNKITTLGSVKPDHQKEQSTKNGRASFSFKLSDLKNHALLGMTKIAIKGMASGYKQKDSVTVSANKLLDILDANKTSLTIKIPMISDSQGDFDRFEVHCDKPEIFEDQVSVCKAVIFNKIGKGLDVSKQVNWLPIYVDQIKGKVEGQTVARIEKLPYTLPIKAIFTAPSKHGGKQWPASNSVLIKARGNITKAVISISKSVNVYNISRGDSVTYNYHVRNPGNVSLSKIKIRDDKCSLIKYDSGDNNKDNILDQNETWLFDCSMTLDKNTTNTATVSGEYASGTTVSDTATATVTVHPSGLCPPPKVRVPGVVGQSVTGAKTKLTKIDLRGVIVQMQYIETIDINRVISQSPLKNECVDKHSKVNLWVSRGPEIITEPDKEMFSAVLLPDCIGSFEIVAGAGTSKSCGIRVRGWNQSDERVEVTVSYPSSSELIVFPGDTSASPHNMYNPGIADDKDKYIFSELFRAQDNAPIGITPVTITVSQKGVGSVTLRTNVSVLPKGSSVSSGCGVRPPAIVSRGSGGDYCVWRFKRFNSNPACFSFHMGKCDDSQFYYPKYELMGENMTNGEAWKRHRELGVEDDSYSCSPPDCDDDIDGDGTEDDQDGCPDDPKKQDPGKCGCNQSDRDLDKDGIPDCLDNCTSGIDLNTDGDSLADCEDGCPNNPDLIKPDEICNSCWPDDADEDGVLDCNDECPNDKNKTDAKHCGCNKLETDTDGDLWPDCIDECPNNSELTAFPSDIEAFLKTIDAGIQPARKALRDCEGMFIFTNLKNLKEKLARKQCKGALGITMRLKEVELLEKIIDPKNCSGEEKKECDIAPTTTFPQAARQCEVRQRIWGYGHGCFSEEKIAALKAEDGTTINCTTECNYCPKGYKKAVYNGYEGCVKCPKGKHFSNGCCR